MARMKSGPRNVLLALVIFGALFGVKIAFDQGLIPGLNQRASVVPSAVNLPQAQKVNQPTANTVAPVNMPSTTVSNTVSGPAVTWYQMAWQSQTAANFANGGPVTTKGSLMEKNGVRLNIVRQDDVEQMKALLVEAAEKMAKGRDDEGGVWVAIMGDGAPAFFASVNTTLEKIGPEYIAQGFFSCGFSRGEDKLMGPPEWKESPQLARGKTVASYIKDGDWNIMIEWANANQIPVNPDPTTYCPDALNNWAANDFLHAAALYNGNAREERPIVDLQGKRTGKKAMVTVDGVATWTPGDVNVAEGRGGLANIVSTNEYYWQMPNLVIGIKKWLEANPKTVEGFIEAATDAADQVKTRPEVLKFATSLNGVIWDEEQYPGYWLKYFSIQRVRDSQGVTVELGGSSVNNLADNLQLFGLLEGSADLYKQVYTEFGDILVEQYPQDVPNYPDVTQVVNKRFLRNVQAKRGTQMTAPDAPVFASTGKVDEISRRAWNIEFDSGQATFTPAALSQLEALYRQISVGRLTVVIEGHTDSDGDADFNMALSERRAFAVRDWIQSQAPSTFPNSRFRVRSFGETSPVAPNSTEAGKAQNRRVEIALGTTE